MLWDIGARATGRKSRVVRRSGWIPRVGTGGPPVLRLRESQVVGGYPGRNRRAAWTAVAGVSGFGRVPGAEQAGRLFYGCGSLRLWAATRVGTGGPPGLRLWESQVVGGYPGRRVYWVGFPLR